MFDYCNDSMQMPMHNMFNPMAAMPVQNAFNPMAAMPAQNAFNPMAAMPMQNMFNPMAAMPTQNMYNPMAVMPEEELENLFPQTYKVIQPEVEKACDKLISKFGEKCPGKTDVESMVSDIYDKVEPNIETIIKNSPMAEERQFFGGGRRILRDFITALFISNLIRRRRRPFFGFPFSPFGVGFF
jgi:hypothetical protein